MAEPAYPLHAGPFTAADRDAIPCDGRRVELLDGALVVSPSPGRAHNDYVIHVFRLLDAERPPGVTVYNVPYDFYLADGSIVVPDILVMRTEDLGARGLFTVPLLAVETISPSSRLTDPLVKRAKYEANGVPAYWIVDPDAPSLTALDLVDGRYETRAVLGSNDEATLQAPYPVAVHLRLEI